MIITKDNLKFGGYIDTLIDKRNCYFDDPKAFLFTLKDIDNPMKFDVKPIHSKKKIICARERINNKPTCYSSEGLYIGNLSFCFDVGWDSNIWYTDIEEDYDFDFKNIKYAMSGFMNEEDPYIYPSEYYFYQTKRAILIQMG